MEHLRELKEELKSVRAESKSRSDLPPSEVLSPAEPVAPTVSPGESVAPRPAHPAPRRHEREILDEMKSLRSEFERWLDAGYGSCLFAENANRVIVENALRHHEGVRYSLYAFVVMPNHVHVLFQPTKGQTIESIVRDLKHFVSAKLSARKVWKGGFWQGEYWDTLIRDAGHFERVRAYIRKNAPEKAYDAYEGC